MPRSSLVSTGPAHVVVLGGGYAGVLAALRVAGLARGSALVTLVNERARFVERIRLHQVATGQAVVQRELLRMLRGTGVELVISRARSIDASARKVVLGDGRELSWDYLIYALGSGADKSAIPGSNAHAYGIGNEDSARRLAGVLHRLGAGASVAVIGGGLCAIELASEIAESRRELAVSMFTVGPVGPGLSEGGRGYVRRTLVELGIELNEDACVSCVTNSGLVLESGRAHHADAVVDCSGLVAPSVGSSWGLASTREGRLSIDETLRSVSDDRVFGAGDGAAIAAHEAAFLRMACATAMPLGAHAGDNVVRAIRGEPLLPFGFGFAGQCVSLGRKRGILQYVDAQDAPTERFVSGWLAARLKEAICRYTTLMLAIERMLPGTFTWPRRRARLGAPSAKELTA